MAWIVVSEQVTREFAKDSMAAAAGGGVLPDTLAPFLWRGEGVLDTGCTITVLVGRYPWAQQAVVDEIERVSALSPQPVDYLTQLALLLADAANPRSYEMVQARFKQHTHYLELIRIMVSRSIGPGAMAGV